MALTAPVAMLDGLSVTLTGILRAIGRPMPGTVAQFVAHYVFAIPLGILLTFYFEWGVYGVWVGLLGKFHSISFVPLINFRSSWADNGDPCSDHLRTSN
jgi:MATE family multidrug resistance protein